MNAVILRNIMIGSIILALGAIGALIYYATGYLQTEVAQTVHTKIDAEMSHNDLDRIKRLESILKTNQASVEKAAQIVSESKQYEYQDQIVSDINTYAARTGVRVLGFDFGDAFAKSQTKTQATVPKVDGVKTISVTLSLEGPVQYDNYLTFVKAIEKNLTKMQVSGVILTPDSKTPSMITNPTVNLTVFVR